VLLFSQQQHGQDSIAIVEEHYITNSNICLDDSTKNKPNPSIAVLEFTTTEKTKYALDSYREIYAKVPEYFMKYKPTVSDMIASAKFMLPGESDEIFVGIKESQADFDPAKVRFVTGNGKEYNGIYDNQTKGWVLNLVGSPAGDGQEIYAVYEESKGKFTTLDKLNVYSYERKTVNIKLVPVNGFMNSFNVNTLSSELNKIYCKVGVTCNLSMAETGFSYTPVNGNSFDVTGSGLFSTETADMKAIKQAYNTYLNGNIESNTLYLFVIEKVTGAEGVAGDMPRGKQFGYLFPGADARTVAHEIGHGAFNLEHPFDRPLRGQFDKGQLAHCLMDYASGTEFCKLEWDAINAPGLVIGLLETDEGGMAPIQSDEKLYACLEEIRQSLVYGTEIKTRSYLTLSDGEIPIGGHTYSFITVKRMNTTKSSFSIKDTRPELSTEKNNWGTDQYCIGYLNNTVTIVLASKEERDLLLSYLSGKRSNSYLLFVSGYGFDDEIKEFLNKNEAEQKNETWWADFVGFVQKNPVSLDSKEYWGNSFVDNFVTRLQPKKVTYMSGHDNIGTSNHKIIGNFVTSWLSNWNVRYNANTICFRNPTCMKLAITPNVAGFNQRRNNGKQRGADYVNQLKADCEKGSDGLVHDTIDIVCHSMGFAHALGVIDVIKEAMKTDLKGLKFGRFYIIAPENACSGEVDVKEWEEVWQYGSDEVNHLLWLQDGIAPQCRINGLLDIPAKSGRAYIPLDTEQGFLDSHSISNYGWIFNSIQKGANGYVTPRQ
jgi:hypothetical protein